MASLTLTPRGHLLFTAADGTFQPPVARLRALERDVGALIVRPAPPTVPAGVAPGSVARDDTRPEPGPTPSPAPAFPQPPPPHRPIERPIERPPVPVASPVGWAQLEGLLGGTWLNRIGVLVFIFGVGFFLKLAFDNDWITPGGRVAIGIVAGCAMLFAGARLQRAAYRVPAQGLVAAGIATLYLSAYAAYGFYHLIPQSGAFAFMVLVTATGIGLAIHHDARAIAILANLGGFLTPIILSTGRDAAVTLFTYLAILDAGMLASAYWRRWPELTVLSFLSTHALYWGWFDAWYRPEKLAVALISTSVFFLLFALVAPVEATGERSGRRAEQWSASTALTLAVPTVYFVAARAILASDHRTWLAVLCLAQAALYLGVGWWIARWIRDGGPLALFHFAIALAFLTLTFPIQFADHGVTIAWSVEGAVLLWGGLQLASRYLRLGALAVIGLAGARWLTLLAEQSAHSGFFIVDHPAFLPTVFFLAACGGGDALSNAGIEPRRMGTLRVSVARGGDAVVGGALSQR